MDARYIYSDSSGRLELELSQDDVDSVPQSGPADDAIADLLTSPEIASQLEAFDPAALADSLREWGAWDDAELSDHAQNRARYLWLACCDCREQPDLYRN